MIKRNRVITGVTALAVVLSSGVVAFAASETAGTEAGKGRQAIMVNLTAEQREAVQQARIESMEEAAAELVESGDITKDIANKLTAVKSIVKDSSKESILTDEQRTALREEEQSLFEALLDDLADDGTLTDDEADQMETGKGMMRGLNLTDEQKEAVMQARADAREQAAANLVEDGTITQEEADAVASMPKRKVTSRSEDGALLTDEQKTALSEAVKSKLESKLADLVEDGTLTQDLADQLLDGNGMFRMGFGGKPGRGPCPAGQTE